MFKTEVSPNYTLIGDQGQVITYQQVLSLYEQNTLNPYFSELSDLKVSQHGNIGIATGITNHGFKNKTNGATASYKERFTYIHEFKNGKWQVLSGHHTTIQAPASEDEAAIKKALDDDRIGFHNADKNAMTKLWKDDPKSFFIANYTDGRYYYFDNEGIKKAVANAKPTGKIPNITSSKINIKGNFAVVDFEQTNTNQNGTKGHEHDIALLEKVGNEWKIIGHSGHGVPTSTTEDEAAIKKALDDETTTFHTNPQEITKYWKLDDKTFMMGTWDDGKFTMFDAEKLKAALKTLTPQNSKGVKSNHRINIKGNIAIVDFDQVTTATDGSKGYQHNLCLLEKTNGEWKFIGSSIYKTTGL